MSMFLLKKFEFVTLKNELLWLFYGCDVFILLLNLFYYVPHT